MEILKVKEQRSEKDVLVGYLLNEKISVPLAEGNREYIMIQEWLKGNTPEPAFSQEEILARTIKALEAFVVIYIQDAVDAYNVKHGLIYKDVHSAASYRFDIDYAHQAFCDAVWKWNVAVWEKCRALLAEGTILTEAELKAELPVFSLQEA